MNCLILCQNFPPNFVYPSIISSSPSVSFKFLPIIFYFKHTNAPIRAEYGYDNYATDKYF